MPTCLTLRHLPFEGLDTMASMLVERGFEVRYLDVAKDPVDAAACAAADLLIVLGGPIGACDEAAYPFLLDELAVIHARIEADQPLLGICLGSQLMARAMGARNHSGTAVEIGWSEIELTAAGQDSCLVPLAEGPVFQWHSDTFDLPEGATQLARSAVCAQQAFQRGRALALQFHPEVSAAQLQVWYLGHARALADPASPDVHTLRNDADRYAADLTRRLAQMLDTWLAEVELGRG